MMILMPYYHSIRGRGMLRAIDIIVKTIYAIILSFISLLALFMIPPAGIILLLWLSNFIDSELNGKTSKS
jgi:hypothetical protein